MNASWIRRLNPEDQINRKPEDQNNLENFHWTENAKNARPKKNEPNIGPFFHLVNFDVPIEKVKLVIIH